MRRIRFIVPCAALLLAMACISSVASAQVLYGSLTGNVTDPAGAAVPGVHVEAVNQGTNVKSETDTDIHGIYRFTNLQEGLYKVTVTAKSFQTFIETNVQVQVSAVRRVDVQLQVATVTQSVEVSADSGGAANRQGRYPCGDFADRKWNSCRTTARKARTSRRCCCCNRAPTPRRARAKPIRRPATRSAPSRYLRTAFRPKPTTPASMARPIPIHGCRSTWPTCRRRKPSRRSA